MEDKDTSIACKNSTKQRLASHGTTTESMDTVMNKILDEVERPFGTLKMPLPGKKK